jgi:hypothetical protein
MVPLDSVTGQPAREPDLAIVEFTRPPRPETPPQPRRPREFKVLDVMTQVLVAEGAGIRETLDVLRGYRSIADVLIYVWEPVQVRWRMLTLDEQRALWRHRDAQAA